MSFINSAGLASGITEAVLVVTPTEVLKIRLQTTKPRGGVPGAVAMGYRNTPEALYTIVRTEGVKVLWTGIGLTAARQGTNQAGKCQILPSKPRCYKGIFYSDVYASSEFLRLHENPSGSGGQPAAVPFFWSTILADWLEWLSSRIARSFGQCSN
jgi:Mitochondrial carrier protein.